MAHGNISGVNRALSGVKDIADLNGDGKKASAVVVFVNTAEKRKVPLHSKGT